MTKKPGHVTTPRDPLLLEVVAALGAGRVELGPIHDGETLVHGLAFPNGRVRINPAPEIADSAIHELIHRLRPGWSERSVRRKTTQLMRQLSNREIDKLYELVLVTAARRKAAV